MRRVVEEIGTWSARANRAMRRVGVFFLSHTSVLQRLFRTLVFSLLGLSYIGVWGRVLSATLFFVSLALSAIWGVYHPLAILHDTRAIVDDAFERQKQDRFEISEPIEAVPVPSEWDRVFVFLLQTLLCTDIYFSFISCFIDAVLLIEVLSPMFRLGLMASCFVVAFATAFIRYRDLNKEYQSTPWWSAFLRHYGQQKQGVALYEALYGQSLRTALMWLSKVWLFLLISAVLLVIGGVIGWLLFPFQHLFAATWPIVLLIELVMVMVIAAGVGVLFIWQGSQDRQVQIEHKARSMLAFWSQWGNLIGAIMVGGVMAVCYWQQFQMIVALFLGDALLLSTQVHVFSYVFLGLSLILGAADGYCDYHHKTSAIHVQRLQVEAWVAGYVTPASLQVAMAELIDPDGPSQPPESSGAGPTGPK